MILFDILEFLYSCFLLKKQDTNLSIKSMSVVPAVWLWDLASARFLLRRIHQLPVRNYCVSKRFYFVQNCLITYSIEWVECFVVSSLVLSEQHWMELNISREREQEVSSQDKNWHNTNVKISLVCSAPRPVAATALGNFSLFRMRIPWEALYTYQVVLCIRWYLPCWAER